MVVMAPAAPVATNATPTATATTVRVRMVGAVVRLMVIWNRKGGVFNKSSSAVCKCKRDPGLQNESGELTVTPIRGLAILDIVATSFSVLVAWLAIGFQRENNRLDTFTYKNAILCAANV